MSIVPGIPALIKSASKADFMNRLRLERDNPNHRQLFLAMKEESVRTFEALLKNKREMLKPAYVNMSPPFAANHFTDEAFKRAVLRIYETAHPSTKWWYDQGRTSTTGDNWIILWMLYHVCRYRDARNSKATSREFHDDDDLEMSSISEGQSSLSVNGSTGPIRPYYDAAREEYREYRK